MEWSLMQKSDLSIGNRKLITQLSYRRLNLEEPKLILENHRLSLSQTSAGIAQLS